MQRTLNGGVLSDVYYAQAERPTTRTGDDSLLPVPLNAKAEAQLLAGRANRLVIFDAQTDHRVAVLQIVAPGQKSDQQSLDQLTAELVLWFRAHRGRPPDRWSFHLGGRVSVRCDPRRITLITPPGAGPAEDAAEARALAGRLRNDQARWAAGFTGVTRGAKAECACQSIMRQTHVEGRSWIPAAAAYRPLLEALEDPDRFIVAHHLLCQFKSVPTGPLLAEVREREVFADDDGLRVELGPPTLLPNSDGTPTPEDRPNVNGELPVIAGQHDRFGTARDSVIIAGHPLEVASDGITASGRPGPPGSLLYSGAGHRAELRPAEQWTAGG